MNMFNRISQNSALCALLLLSISLPVSADDIQDASKLLKQGQLTLALEKVEGILTAKPNDAQARFLKGLIYTEQGKTSEAIKVFNSLTSDYPELPEPYNNLAVLYASLGQYEKAKTSLEMAIRTHPSYATAHENLGDIYAKMASQAYDRALQLDKSNTSTQTKLEMIKELFGSSTGKAIIAPHNVASTAKSGNTAAAPVAAAKPVAVVAPPAKPLNPIPAADNSGDVIKLVHEWAAAWSAKNSKKYLAFYGKEFKTPDGESRNAWEAQRQERIAKPKSIHVEIKDAKVKLIDDNHATVSFKQFYRASHLQTSASKTMELTKSNGRWFIVEERAGK